MGGLPTPPATGDIGGMDQSAASVAVLGSSFLSDIGPLWWPLAFFLVFLIFRKDISALLNRINRLKWKDAAAELSDVNQQADKLESIEKIKDRGEEESSDPAATSSDGGLRHKDTAMSAFDSLLLTGIEDAIQSDPKLTGDPDPQRRQDALVRALAHERTRNHLEKVYNLIWGSQIAALEALNQSGAIERSALELRFEATKSNQTIFSGVTFDAWMQFLINAMLIMKLDDGRYAINELGQVFLRYLINERYTKNKPG